MNGVVYVTQNLNVKRAIAALAEKLGLKTTNWKEQEDHIYLYTSETHNCGKFGLCLNDGWTGSAWKKVTLEELIEEFCNIDTNPLAVGTHKAFFDTSGNFLMAAGTKFYYETVKEILERMKR